jgi:hypothetical protein
MPDKRLKCPVIIYIVKFIKDAHRRLISYRNSICSDIFITAFLCLLCDHNWFLKRKEQSVFITVSFLGCHLSAYL